jgi:hypothetical protein
MADEQHLKILKQGVGVWNRWRKEKHDVRPDLSRADLRRVHLRGADLWRANLQQANVSGADLVRAELGGADFAEAKLRGATLIGAHLFEADFFEADLREVDLREADLWKAYLWKANLRRASLFVANLSGAVLIRADLRGADLSHARLQGTLLADLDLSEVRGLETTSHLGPSSIGVDTLQRSHGEIPEPFLRGCGLSDWEIEAARLYRPGLSHKEIGDILDTIHDLRAHRPIQVNPLFISYSHADSPFVDHLEPYLDEQGIRFWRDIHHATSGRLEKQIDRAMRHNPTVLLILSAHSAQSDWVEHEAGLARELEQELGRDVLYPVALDDSWKTYGWPERLRDPMREDHILDLTAWEDEAVFGRMVTKLIEGLGLFYKE